MIPFCEVCFRQQKPPDALLLSSCRHIFCRRCASSLGQCSVCQAACRTVEIRPDTLPTDLKDYFIPAEKLLVKAQKVAQFQAEKQDAFLAGQLQAKLQKYETKKNTIDRLKKHYDSLNAAVREEQTLVRKLRERRKSPGALAASPNSPLLIRSAALARVRRLATPTNQRVGGSERESRWSSLMSQGSNAAQRSGSGSGHGSVAVPDRRPSVSPIATFKKPADLVSTAKAGIYEQTVRNIDRAMQRPRGPPVVKANRRGSDIERARNGMF